MVTPDELARVACASLIGRDFTATQVLPHDGTPGKSPVLRAWLAGGASVVVKLYHDHRQPRAVRHAAAITAVHAHTTVPTADVVACGALPGIDVTALITTDLGSDDLRSTVGSGARSRGQALAAMGRLLSDLHRMPIGALSKRPGGPRVDAADLIARAVW
jgi:hypothetical protein